jgi:hypothetical protein
MVKVFMPQPDNKHTAKTASDRPDVYAQLSKPKRLQLEPVVAMFFQKEADRLEGELRPLRGMNSTLDAWINQVTERIRNPIDRIFRFKNYDLPVLHDTIVRTESALNEVSEEDCRIHLEQLGHSAGELARMTPELVSQRRKDLESARQMYAEGMLLGSLVDPFLAHTCQRVIERESPKRGGPRQPPGFFVKEEYHRLKIFQDVLPEDHKVARVVAQMLGGDLTWVVRRLIDVQRIKHTMVQLHAGLKERSSHATIKALRVEADFPAPLGATSVSGEAFIEGLLKNQISPEMLSPLLQKMERYFLSQAQSVLKAR